MGRLVRPYQTIKEKYMIYSIGYEKTTIEQLTTIMKERNIKTLIDVRSRPYSRRPDKYEFNKNRLMARFAGDPSGDYVRYEWRGDQLGGLPGPATKEGIEFLKAEEAGENVLILMCLENNPRDCHRYQDIGVRLLEHGIDMVHLHDGIEETTSHIVKGGK